MSIENAIYASTYTPARRMNLLDRGTIAPGKLADFILLDSIEDFNIYEVYKNGEMVFNRDKGLKEEFFEDKYTLEHIKKVTYSNKLLENRYLIRKDIA